MDDRSIPRKKISTHLPKRLIEEAIKLTGLNQTEVITEGLKEVVARVKRRRFLDLKGKIKIALNLDELRDRKRF